MTAQKRKIAPSVIDNYLRRQLSQSLSVSNAFFSKNAERLDYYLVVDHNMPDADVAKFTSSQQAFTTGCGDWFREHATRHLYGDSNVLLITTLSGGANSFAGLFLDAVDPAFLTADYIKIETEQIDYLVARSRELFVSAYDGEGIIIASLALEGVL